MSLTTVDSWYACPLPQEPAAGRSLSAMGGFFSPCPDVQLFWVQLPRTVSQRL